VPDPGNQYDSNAIEVRDAAERRKVGFVPQDQVEVTFADTPDMVLADPPEVIEELFGELPKVAEATFAQRLVHSWLAQGPVAALIISERSYRDDAGEWTSQRGGVTVLAGPHLECVDAPTQGDADYAEFAAARLHARADAWPARRAKLRREIDTSHELESRHFAIQSLIHEAYRLRDSHTEALDDAVAACHEQIDLAPRVAAVMRQRYDRPLPAHVGFKQLAIILEKQKAYTQAVDLVEQARAQRWDGDWDKRLERLRRKQQ
jgi:hypothetical protein